MGRTSRFEKLSERLPDCSGIRVSLLGSGDRADFLRAPDALVLLEDPVIGSIAQAHESDPRAGADRVAPPARRLDHPEIRHPARLRGNLAAAEVVLTEADMDRIAGLDRGYRLIAGELWVFEGLPWTLQTLWDD